MIDDERLVSCCPGDSIPPDPVTGRVWKYQRTKANRGLFLMIDRDCLIKRVNDNEDDIIK